MVIMLYLKRIFKCKNKEMLKLAPGVALGLKGVKNRLFLLGARTELGQQEASVGKGKQAQGLMQLF